MPMDNSKYPADWKAISQRIRERDGQCCKWCGIANYSIGARDKNGVWCDAESIERMSASEGEIRFNGYPKYIRIVLTVAHIDHDTTNNADSNLAALCQKCHLGHDLPHHMQNRKATLRRKRQQRIAATGQKSLFEEGA